MSKLESKKRKLAQLKKQIRDLEAEISNEESGFKTGASAPQVIFQREWDKRLAAVQKEWEEHPEKKKAFLKEIREK